MTDQYKFDFDEFYHRPDHRFAVITVHQYDGRGYFEAGAIDTHATFEEAEDEINEHLTMAAEGGLEDVKPEAAAEVLAQFQLQQARARVQNTTCHGHVATLPRWNPWDAPGEDAADPWGPPNGGTVEFHIVFVYPPKTGD